MESVKANFAEGPPLYKQVPGEIRRAIAEWGAAPGERMPLAQEPVSVLGVNAHTLLRAPCDLREEGMLEFGRGRGISDAGTQRGVVMARVKDLVVFARRQGYKPAEIIAMIESVS